MREPGEYSRAIDNSPDYARASCEASLTRLGVDCIDLYYVHRIDTSRPIEEVMDALSALVKEGKIRHIGLSEVSAKTLRRAHAVHPVAAVQTEYSLWTREAEEDLLPTCRELGIGWAPYSPLGPLLPVGTRLPHGFDYNARRFQGWRCTAQSAAENLRANRAIVEIVETMAAKKEQTPAQIAFAWLLAKGDDIVPIPGTRRVHYLEENVAAARTVMSAEECLSLERALDAIGVAGNRYTDEGLKGVNA